MTVHTTHPIARALAIVDGLLSAHPDRNAVRVERQTLDTLRCLLDALDAGYTVSGARLTRIEKAIYSELRLNAGLIVSTERLLSVSGAATNQSLWVHMRRLRCKLEEAGGTEDIRTVNGVGYVYKAEVADV